MRRECEEKMPERNGRMEGSKDCVHGKAKITLLLEPPPPSPSQRIPRRIWYQRNKQKKQDTLQQIDQICEYESLH